MAGTAVPSRVTYRLTVMVAFLVLATLGFALAGPSLEDEPDPKPRVVLPDESAFSPSASDGQGTVTVTPSVVGVREPVTLTFTYTAGGTGIAVGGGVVCMVSRFWDWTLPQDVEPQAPGYVTVRCSDPDVGLDTHVDRSSSGVFARIKDRPLRPGQTLSFVYGDTSGGKNPRARGLSDRYAERGERFFFRVDGDGDGFFTPIQEQPRLRVEARHPYRLAVFTPASAQVGKPLDLHVSILDRSNNLVEGFAGTVSLMVLAGKSELPPEVKMVAGDRGAKPVRVVPQSAGVLLVQASDPEGRLEAATSNPTLVSDEQPRAYRLYWGDLQGHSNFSDGSASPEEWWRYARDVARLDVAVLTDHDHWGYTLLDQDEAAWQHLLQLSRSFYEPGKFVTFPGYEWTNWQYGHKHVIFLRESEASVFSAFEEKSDHPKELWSALGSRECITVNHHTGGGPIPTFWKYHHPHFEPVVEMTSVHGVSEAIGHPKCIYHPVESGMVQSALARGYRLGFIGSGDTHDGHPGIGGAGGGCMGLAGIYATELTREAILEALRARRVYATTGCRAVLRFHMGEVTMGGVVELETPRQERKLSISVLGDAPIAHMTLVKNNEPVYKQQGADLLEAWEWTDPEPAHQGDYYYARISQTDGHWIYSSPIWIEVKKP